MGQTAGYFRKVECSPAGLKRRLFRNAQSGQAVELAPFAHLFPLATLLPPKNRRAGSRKFSDQFRSAFRPGAVNVARLPWEA
jgi:hypothetical protein